MNKPSPPVSQARRSSVVRHILLSILMWLTYVLYWRVVVSRGVERDAQIAFLVLGLFIVFQVLTTQVWILHNRAKAKAHAGRRAVRAAGAPAPGSDFLGRRVRVFPAGADLQAAGRIIVRIDEDDESQKIFETDVPAEAVDQRELPAR